MSRIRQILVGLILLASLLLAACSELASETRGQETEATSIPTVVGDGTLIVEGKLVPAATVNLSFNMGGVITEVLVMEGDAIEAGEVIARLDQRERLAAGVAAAELELVNARQAFEMLEENVEVSTAAALQRVADARDQLRSAERYLNNLMSGSRITDIDKASANVVLFKDKLDQAQKDFAAYENKPEDNLTRAAYLSALADAQQHYDDAVRLLNNLEGNPSEIDLAIAEADLALAQASLSLAEQEYEDVRAGPDPDDLEVVEARLKAAESGLNAAQAALADAELVTPISGTIVKLEIKAGEQSVPGLLAAVVADLSGWRVETEDLNEMEIPRVHIDQPVTVIPDALPEIEIAGRVESIGDLYEEKFGDVTYTTKIVLSEADPRLRWGMTVLVRFEP